jgi:hypothetical protein
MGIREMVENPPAISDLPIWRKTVLVAAVVFSLFIAAVAVDKHLRIYASAPDHPVPATGQVHEVDVMHGYIRYVTLQEKESFLLWAGRVGSWAGAAFVAAFFLWITSPRKSVGKHRPPDKRSGKVNRA